MGARTSFGGSGALVLIGSLLAIPQWSWSAEPDANVDPNAVEVRLVDRSAVRMSFQHESLDVTTRYGKLTVPTHDIQVIHFGLRVPAETHDRIQALIAQLGDEQFEKRETAQRELVRLKELAYPAVLRAMKETDAETSRRATKIAASIEESVEAERLAVKHYDTIVTNEFSIAGTLELTKLKARTPVFGEAQLDVAAVRSIRWLRNMSETNVELDASRYGVQADMWLTTDVEIEPGMRLEITASGTIDLMPHGQAGQFMATPAGPANPQNVGMGGAVGRRPYAPGTLLGKIGPTGEVFQIGDNYRGTAKAAGKLLLRSAPGQWNNPPSGTYAVKVKAKYE
jgi:hypothetical protein